MVAIVNKTPKQLGLKEMLEAYIAHQKEVVTYRTQYDLEKAEDRAHVLEGLVKALNILDDVIATIKASKNRQDAQHNLVTKFEFTERQADAILTLQLYRLTNLEIHALEKDLKDITKQIAHLRGILDDPKKLLKVIKEELAEIHDRYGIDRRSEIRGEVEELKVNLEVMVTPEDVKVALTNEGYIKRTSMMSFTRSGGEAELTGMKEGDYLRCLFEVNTVDSLLIFTNKGQYFHLPVHQIPEYKWKDNGTAIVNVIPITKEDRIVSVIPVKDFNDSTKSLVFLTKQGQVKRTLLSEYATNRLTAIAACKLSEGDEVIDVKLSTGDQELLLVSKLGQSIRFKEEEVSSMGRVSGGVRGINLAEGDEVIGGLWLEGDEGEVLVFSDRGYAKRSLVVDYPLQGRGGKGVSTFEFKEGKRVRSNGSLLFKAFLVKEAYMLSIVTSSGEILTVDTEKVPIEDRRSTGKQVIPLAKDQEILDIVKLT